LDKRYDPGTDRFDAIRDFARAHDLEVVETSKARHDVILEGSANALGHAFGVELHEYAHAGGRYYAPHDAITVPNGLHDIVDGVLGLDNVPVHRTHATPAASKTTFTPAQLAEHYRFPAQDAAGERIALFQFGGGYVEDDIEAFARKASLHLPNIRAIGIRGADGIKVKNAPLRADQMKALATAWKESPTFAQLSAAAGANLDAFMASLEATMDIELSAALGGGADIDVYFAPQGADGWRRAIYAAIGEPYAGSGATSRRPATVISISWGENESAFDTMKLRLIHNALNAAELKGVAVCSASGDRGSANVMGDTTHANVNFPASSPAVLAIGGTRIMPSRQEIAWKGELFGAAVATGGGMSGFFPRPAWQQGPKFVALKDTWKSSNESGFVGRWVPDVSANAAFESGVEILCGGQRLVGGGTSAAAPLWAALLARGASALGHPLAGLNAWLYAHNESVCVGVQDGDNDVGAGDIPWFRATVGWDACTGFGVPNGVALLQKLIETAPQPSSAAPPRERRRTPRHVERHA
jgi:kumamolisin